MTWAAYVATGVALAAAMLGAWMLLVEPRLFRVRRIVLRAADIGNAGASPAAPSRLPPLKILHVTDTHLRGPEAAKLRFLRRVAREAFDLVFLTGDLMDTPQGLDSCIELAGILHGRLGCFAVLGGHDYFLRIVHERGGFFRRPPGVPSPPGEGSIPNPVAMLVEGMRAQGVQVLQDESRVVTCKEGEFAIVGLEDAFLFEPDYDAAWRDVPDGLPTIVVAHSPDVLLEIVRRGCDLAFFGHTHGGQVRLPFVGAVLTRSRLEPHRASGVFREGPTVFSLNNGLGTDRTLPARLLCPPR